LIHVLYQPTDQGFQFFFNIHAPNSWLCLLIYYVVNLANGHTISVSKLTDDAPRPSPPVSHTVILWQSQDTWDAHM